LGVGCTRSNCAVEVAAFVEALEGGMALMKLKGAMQLLPYRNVLGAPRARLICLPFAGGTAATYREWGALLPGWIDVCAVELPGHGARLGEPPATNMEGLVASITEDLRPLLDMPVVIFGHSLGARIGFAMAARLTLTVGLIVSASPAPDLPPRHFRSSLSTEALISALRLLGGTPQQVLADRELMEVFLPIIRADMGILERGLAPRETRVACPILALASREDREVTFEDAAAWASFTKAEFRLTEMKGNHFYLQPQKDAVLDEVRSALSAWVRG
jgi:surfactin synthase thioesterase subunit